MLLPSWVVSGRFLKSPLASVPSVTWTSGDSGADSVKSSFTSACCVPSTFLDVGGVAVNKTHIASVLVTEVRACTSRQI